jgi:hypothetical protein
VFIGTRSTFRTKKVKITWKLNLPEAHAAETLSCSERLHVHRCFSSKLNFRFRNDKTFSNGPFTKSKVWKCTKILSKVAHFGQISCPNCTLAELLAELVSHKTSPFALISDWVYTLGAVAQNCAA